MKKFLQVLWVNLALTLSACTGSLPEQLMPPLQYQQPIRFHIPKDAYIYWIIGAQYTAMQSSYIPANSGLGGVIAAIIDAEQRRTNPGRYTYSYGKAQQAVFITSLKDILQQHRVFNHIEIITTPRRLTRKNVLITINFKTTRVAEEDHHIIVVAEISITAFSRPPFKRTYLVESDPGAAFSTHSFKQQQTEVSQQLLSKIIVTLQEWQQVN